MTTLLTALIAIITTFIVLSGVFLVLPDVSINSAFGEAVLQASGFLNGINILLPIDTLFDILNAVLAIEIAIFSYKIVMWVIKKIPSIN